MYAATLTRDDRCTGRTSHRVQIVKFVDDLHQILREGLAESIPSPVDVLGDKVLQDMTRIMCERMKQTVCTT